MTNNAKAQTNSAVIPSPMMRAAANSFNSGHMPGNAIDGDINTIWHSEWVPKDDPFPHILTIELEKKITLNNISISPRQDMDAGKITSGQIYVGDSLNDMSLLTAFTGDTGRNATVVDLGQIKAKFIQIHSIKSTSTNTAISKISITTFESDTINSLNHYYQASDLLHKAKIGSDTGNYLQTDVNNFKKEIDDFHKEIMNDNLSNSDYQSINNRIKSACKNFILKAKAYTKSDLNFYIESLNELNDGITVAEDKAAANNLFERADNIYSDPDASRGEIHDIIIELIDFVNSINSADKSIWNLSGEWNLALNDYSTGMQMSDKVNLPGTLDTNKKGTYNLNDDINRLSRYFKYTGPATYQKRIYISEKCSSKNIVLYMERSRQTHIWINEAEVTAANTFSILPVSQKYDISQNLNFGQYNTITIVVDNSYSNFPANPIINSHIATDETQTNWNGILGKFELQINNKVYIDDLRIYPNNDLASVKAEVDVNNTSALDYSGELTLSCVNTSKNINVNIAAGEGKTITVYGYVVPPNLRLWSEFDTTTYEMKASFDNGSSIKKDFGMRVFSIDKDTCSLKINGNKVFLRNETNCAVFPITGYAPMDEASWETLFSLYQSYGINSVRFHSWCPPEAAFCAADKLGLYLQPELSCWDGGMFDSDIKRDYYSKEAYAILKEYASHPSFVMLSFGNELGYQEVNYQYADQLVKDLKQKDSTRLYAPGSNIGHGGTAPASNSDFFTAQSFMNEQLRGSYGGLSGFVNEKSPSSTVNYDDTVKKVFDFNVPFFGFEVGQYQVFPDVLTEPQKYTGVLEARNFKMASDKIKQKNLSEADVSASINASGMLSRIAYKAEIEAAFRTKGMSGISLLGIQDFSGQGTALVGMMNAFGEPKPYDFADPDEFASFFQPIVVLFESSKFCYTNKEALSGNLLLSNYSQSDIQGKINYKLLNNDGTMFFEGKTDTIHFKQGDLTIAAPISIPFDAITVPIQLRLEVSCLQSKNTYDIWVYPNDGQISDGEVYVTDYLDDTAEELLKNGGKVFLSPPALKTIFPNSIEGKFSTAFWSSYDTIQPGTMGLLVDPAHLLFKTFPTDYYSNYQWWAMSTYGRPMNLEDFKDKDGNKIKPLIRVLDGFENLNNLGLLYEASVGNGKIMVSSMNLENLKEKYPEAMALRNSIINYMNSDAFLPEAEVDFTQINHQVKRDSTYNVF